MKIEKEIKRDLHNAIEKAKKRYFVTGGTKLTNPKEIADQEDLAHRRGKYSTEV